MHERDNTLELFVSPSRTSILLPSYLVAPPCRQVAAALTLDYKSAHSTPARSASTSRHIHASLPQKGAQFRWQLTNEGKKQLKAPVHPPNSEPHVMLL